MQRENSRPNSRPAQHHHAELHRLHRDVQQRRHPRHGLRDIIYPKVQALIAACARELACFTEYVLSF